MQACDVSHLVILSTELMLMQMVRLPELLHLPQLSCHCLPYSMERAYRSLTMRQA